MVTLASLLFLPLCSSAGDGTDSLFVVHFSTGPSWDHGKPPAEQERFSEHSANPGRLRADSTILFGARYQEFGMIIMKASSLQAGRQIIEADPGVTSGLFRFTMAPIFPFYKWRE